MRIGDSRSGPPPGWPNSEPALVDAPVGALERREAEARHPQHREVAVRVERDQLGVEPAAVGRLDARALLPRDHVRVGDDEVAARPTNPVPSCTRSHATPSTFTTDGRDARRRVGRDPAGGRVARVG